METIERPLTNDRMTTLFDDSPVLPRAPRKWPYRLWRGTVAFLTITSVAFGISSLVALRDIAGASWQKAFADFKWGVLVTGDQVELDEIGRYLKQLDGVSDVTLLTSNAVVDRLRQEPLLENHLSALESAPLPSVWQVTWDPSFDLSSSDEIIADLKRLPGVVDVAFEQRERDKVLYFRLFWLKLRLALSALAAIGVFLGALLLGRFLFFTKFSALSSARVWESVLVSLAAWMAGLAITQGLVGPFSWQLAWGAVGAALARLAASQTRRNE